MRRVMWIERKLGELAGPATIGWVKISAKGKRLDYQGKVFRTLNGQGFKANYFDEETGEDYWISGCRKDGADALYNTDVEVDQDALEEYWVNIRKKPEKRNVTRFRACGKY